MKALLLLLALCIYDDDQSSFPDPDPPTSPFDDGPEDFGEELLA